MPGESNPVVTAAPVRRYTARLNEVVNTVDGLLDFAPVVIARCESPATAERVAALLTRDEADKLLAPPRVPAAPAHPVESEARS